MSQLHLNADLEHKKVASPKGLGSTIYLMITLVFAGVIISDFTTSASPPEIRGKNAIFMVNMKPPDVPLSTPKVLKKAEVQLTNENVNAAPVNPPKEITPETGRENEVVEKDNGKTPIEETRPAVKETPAPELPPTPVRVGGNIQPPQKTRDVRPVYPMIAQTARVQGIVIIEATIGPDGRVRDAKVLRGIPLLNESALSAVLQWEFTPTTLNNEPVPVVMTVTVQFTLK